MQGELFELSGAATQAAVTNAQEGWLHRFKVTLRLDHLFMIGISALVLYVLVFSFGVEKGKQFALRELRAERARREQIIRALVPPKSDEEPVTKAVFVPSPASKKSVSPGETQKKKSQPATSEIEKQLSSPSTLGKYTIQLITFTSKPRALEEIKRLKGLGYQAYLIPSKKFFQVCVDAFQNMKEAEERLSALREKGFASSDAYIRPLKGHVLA